MTQHSIKNKPSIPLHSPIRKGEGGGLSFSIKITGKDQGRRLDQFLSESHLNLSRSQAKNLIEKHHILLNQRPTKPSARLKEGHTVSGTLPEPVSLSLNPEPIPITILYEDSSIIVIDKPSGMVVHPAYGNPSGTLVNALLYHCKDLAGINGVLRPGIVHRLDKDTSGVMVVAKDDGAYHQLTKQFKNRTVEKAYVAIVCGRFNQDEGFIDSAIGRHPSERKRMSTQTKKGRAALTRWKKIEEFDGATLLEIFPQTGRTHQIRVHLSSIGHPLLGDPLYGRRGRPGAIPDPVLKECIKKMNRQALHAQRLGFNHPCTGERVQFVAPIPRDMEEVLECLRSQTKNLSLSLPRSSLKIKNSIPHFEIPELAKLGWIRHAFLTRQGGVSLPPYDSLNLSDKNADQEKFVSQNKNLIADAFGFDSNRLILLDQMQQDQILLLQEPTTPLPSPLEYDALVTNVPNTYLGILTADCLPIFIVDQKRKVIAAVHAGRQGTALHITAKVIEKMKEEFGCSSKDLLLAIGPCIGPCCYEVDEKVFQKQWEPFSASRRSGKWMVDLVQINIAQMKGEEVKEEQISWINLCTYCHSDLFFSYRKQGRTGRQLSFIGIK